MCRAVERAEDLDSLLAVADGVVLGPGLGRSEWSRSLWRRVMNSDLPLVVDADGLNLLAELGAPGARGPASRSDWLLTPHPGDAARLLGSDVGAVQNDRLGAVRALAAHYGATAVLKGACTLVAVPKAVPNAVPNAIPKAVPKAVPKKDAAARRAAVRRAASTGAGPSGRRLTAAESAAGVDVRVCDYGNPGMGTAGVGDVLAGVLGGLLVQLRDLPSAARTGVLLHALAGDDAAAEDGERGLVASDLLPAIRRRANPTWTRPR
jgi:NAD(P)H-hydrate epimerase